MSKYNIRRATAQDFPVISSINALSFVDKLDCNEGWWWVAVDNKGTVVAFSGICLALQYSNCAYFSRVGVLPTAQGRGLQKRFIRAYERLLRGLKIRWVYTDTSFDNCGSICSLISSGYKVWLPPEGEQWVTGYSSPVYWWKDLTSRK